MKSNQEPQIYEFAEVEEEIKNNVANPSQYYDFQAIDFVVSHEIGEVEDVAYFSSEQDLAESLEQFRNGDRNRAVISLHISLDGASKPNHFVGLYVQRTEDGFEVSYIDPTGLDTMPDDVADAILQTLGVENEDVVRTANMIQYNDNQAVTNVHCGAFVTEILASLATGEMRIVEGRLQGRILSGVEDGFVDVEDRDEEESNRYGKFLRKKHLKLLGRDVEDDLELIGKRIAQGVVVSDRYQLTRSDSEMTNYTDLLSEMVDDQIGEDDLGGDRKRDKDYEIFDIKTKSPEIDKVKKSLNAAKKPVREAEKKRLEGVDKQSGATYSTPEKKNRKYHNEYEKKYSSSPQIVKLEQQLEEEKTKTVESPLSKNQKGQRLHLFRGKALNSKKLDKDGNLIERDPQEIKDIITLKHRGTSLQSDGLIANPERKQVIQDQTRAYLRQIKTAAQKGESSTAIFNAGKTYDSAVRDLMTRTGAKGNTVVATSKFPWVAAEYEAGNMGGAAGGDRAVVYGYSADKKPVRRVLGNGYAISVTMRDYVRLRQDGDLIDVNVDMGRGVKVNQMIEEVTFNAEIPGEMVRGNLPMVLPRFDRNYDDMTEEKRQQYQRVFNLDRKQYNKYRDKFLQNGGEGDVPIGEIVEHLIMHHGFLLREIAIQSDRGDGYKDQFMVPRNELYQSSLIDDVRLTGRSLANRAARKDNAKAKASYVEQDEVPNPSPSTARSSSSTTTQDSVVNQLASMNINKKEGAKR